MVMVTLGTGVGGAVIADGTLVIGANGSAAELGHLRFVRGGRRAAAGRTDASSSMRPGGRCSASSVTSQTPAGSASGSPRTAAPTVSCGPQLALLDEGDEGAIEAVRRVATALGEACGGFQAVLDPELFVIGGSGRPRRGAARAHPHRVRIRFAGFGDRPTARFVTAMLGNDAGLVGVADLPGSVGRRAGGEPRCSTGS
jgi:glucokinase